MKNEWKIIKDKPGAPGSYFRYIREYQAGPYRVKVMHDGVDKIVTAETDDFFAPTIDTTPDGRAFLNVRSDMLDIARAKKWAENASDAVAVMEEIEKNWDSI